jgi:hypothetical protein
MNIGDLVRYKGDNPRFLRQFAQVFNNQPVIVMSTPHAYDGILWVTVMSTNRQETNDYPVEDLERIKFEPEEFGKWWTGIGYIPMAKMSIDELVLAIKKASQKDDFQAMKIISLQKELEKRRKTR